jgi:hypothetical protein
MKHDPESVIVYGKLVDPARNTHVLAVKYRQAYHKEQQVVNGDMVL